jgi:hypothetical protein
MDFGGLPCTNFMNNSLCHPILLAAILWGICWIIGKVVGV